MIALLVAANLAAAIGVDERIGATVPTDGVFVDPVAGAAPLEAHLGRGQPALVVLGYARCELLCSVVLRGVAEGVRGMALAPGRDVAVVTITIDPDEDAAASARTHAALVDAAGRPGWRYLRGAPDEVARVAAALGVRYASDPDTGEIAHPAVLVVLTPDRRVSRYLHGVRFAPALLDAAARDAAAGALAADGAEEALRCFRFGAGAEATFRMLTTVFRTGGAAIAVAVGLVLAALIRRRRRAP